MEETELLDIPYEFKDNIERVWFWIRDAKLLNIIANKGSTPIEVTKGVDTWTLGNEFKGELISISKYKAICVESESLPFFKRLKWEFHLTELNKVITQSLSLYKGTENDTTVSLWRIEFPIRLVDLLITEGKTEKINECRNNFYEALHSIEKILRESSINLSQYEGGVIHAPMKSVWDFIINSESMKQISDSLNITIEAHKDVHVGGMVRINTMNNNGYYLATITKVDCKLNPNKWVIGFEVFESEPKIPFQEACITLIKVNQQECHLAFFNEFREPTSPELLQSVSKNKKIFIELIKCYVEKQIKK